MLLAGGHTLHDATHVSDAGRQQPTVVLVVSTESAAAAGRLPPE